MTVWISWNSPDHRRECSVTFLCTEIERPSSQEKKSVMKKRHFFQKTKSVGKFAVECERRGALLRRNLPPFLRHTHCLQTKKMIWEEAARTLKALFLSSSEVMRSGRHSSSFLARVCRIGLLTTAQTSEEAATEATTHLNRSVLRFREGVTWKIFWGGKHNELLSKFSANWSNKRRWFEFWAWATDGSF